MSLREDLLPDLDVIRAIPAELGLHRFQVFVRKIVWSGARVGMGTASRTDTRLLVGGRDPHVRLIKQKDVVAGASEKQLLQYDIGPLTPEFTGGGHEQSELNPQNDGRPTEVFYVLKGPGMPDSGLLFMRTDDAPERPFRYMVRVKSTGKAA